MKLNAKLLDALTAEAVKKEVISKKEIKAFREFMTESFEGLHIVKSGKGFKLTYKDDESDKLKNLTFKRINQLGTKQQDIKNYASLQNKLSYALHNKLFKELETATDKKTVIDLVQKILNNEVVTLKNWTYSKNESK